MLFRSEQEIFRLEGNPRACWMYEEIRLDNVDRAKNFFFRPVRKHPVSTAARAVRSGFGSKALQGMQVAVGLDGFEGFGEGEPAIEAEPRAPCGDATGY